jgi:methionyl-tRNA synthetase
VGIPAPFAGAEGKVIYVWAEAALGYVSATIEYFEKRGERERWREFWFGDDVKQVYTQGKDNITFHTLIFPGQLIASGEGYHLPDQISATEHLQWIGKQRFSKSQKIGALQRRRPRAHGPALRGFLSALQSPGAQGYRVQPGKT